jgi:hypothetical protein
MATNPVNRSEEIVAKGKDEGATPGTSRARVVGARQMLGTVDEMCRHVDAVARALDLPRDAVGFQGSPRRHLAEIRKLIGLMKEELQRLVRLGEILGVGK